uniref:Copia protein n=1 Tax=Cajanus cajan TaxID=3821 RepID=A0A151T261_CAJCA|nr:Copia protein [Cajanus cajan]
MYLIATRPDILNAVNILSMFMHLNRIIRYVKGISDFGVKFSWSKEFKLTGFSNSDWDGSIDVMRKKQEIVPQSTVEAEFIAETIVVNQDLWLRKIVVDLNLEQKESTKILLTTKLLLLFHIILCFMGKLSISTPSYSS